MSQNLRRYQEVVQKALEFVRSGPDARMTVADVARHVSYSPDHLKRIFREVTGRGVLPNLNEVRIEKAKSLLRQTSLNVGEVAAAVGCENHSAFTRLFRRIAGASPVMFRRLVQGTAQPDAAQPAQTIAGDAKVVLRDDLAAGPLAGCWKPLSGNWAPMNGFLRGTGTERLELGLSTPVPENFRLEFEVRIDRPKPHHFSTILQSSGKDAAPYCVMDFQTGRFRFGDRHLQSASGAIPASGQWCVVRLDVNDNRIAVDLDGIRAVAFRDVFPPPYASRCRLSFSGFGNSVHIRRFRMLDLGFLSIVPAIRQGDVFFNSGLFKQATEFYVRHLRPSLPVEEQVELRFKIAMCSFRQGQVAQCREWVQSILSLTKDASWHRECDLLLLRLEADAGLMDDFEKHARRSFLDPLLRNQIRPILAGYRTNMLNAGFCDRALRLSALHVAIEKETPDLASIERLRMARILKHLKYLPKAERLLRQIGRTAGSEDRRLDALVSLSDVALMQKNVGEARRFVREARRILRGRPEEASCDFQEGLCLRAERKYREAVDLWLSIRARHPESGSWRHIAEAAVAELLCCLGEAKETSSLVARVRKEAPATPFPHGDLLGGYVRVSHLVEKRYEELASLLLPESRRHDTQLSRHGQEMVTAGILLELAGKREEADKVWGEAGRRYPAERCYFWGALAQALASGKPDRLASMKLFYRVRSEMFFLAGLLYEHRGHAARARRLFALSVEEDPTLNWPALLASRKRF